MILPGAPAQQVHQVRLPLLPLRAPQPLCRCCHCLPDWQVLRHSSEMPHQHFLGFWTTASLGMGMVYGDTTAFHTRREGFQHCIAPHWSTFLILGSLNSTQCVKSSQGWHPVTTKGSNHLLQNQIVTTKLTSDMVPVEYLLRFVVVEILKGSHYLPHKDIVIITAIKMVVRIIFPFFRYGPGGGQETKNALCVLGLNMINDKIFMVFKIKICSSKINHHHKSTWKNTRFSGSSTAS